MSNVKDYKNLIAFHPGYYIKEIIDSLGITQEEFAKRLGTTGKNISKLVNGEQNLSLDIARKLSNMLGNDIEFWLNLQKAYEVKVAEIQEKEELDAEISVLKLIDYKYFCVNFGLPEYKGELNKKVKELRQLLKVSSLSLLRNKDLLASFRAVSSKMSDKNIINSNIMLQLAMDEVRNTDAPKYNEQRLKEVIGELLTLTVKKPNEFYPQMKEFLYESGVVLVILPHLSNSGVNGAVKKVGDNVMLMINDRRTYADTFWFSFFHEIAHIVNGDFQISFEKDVKNDEIENRADKYARDKLIPQEKYREFLKMCIFDEQAVKAFAKEINRAPGIVVGRLQYDNKVEHNSNLNHLKEKYKIELNFRN
jgi:addiction module antidote protein HigA